MSGKQETGMDVDVNLRSIDVFESLIFLKGSLVDAKKLVHREGGVEKMQTRIESVDHLLAVTFLEMQANGALHTLMEAKVHLTADGRPMSAEVNQ